MIFAAGLRNARNRHPRTAALSGSGVGSILQLVVGLEKNSSRNSVFRFHPLGSGFVITGVWRYAEDAAGADGFLRSNVTVGLCTDAAA